MVMVILVNRIPPSIALPLTISSEVLETLMQLKLPRLKPV